MHLKIRTWGRCVRAKDRRAAHCDAAAVYSQIVRCDVAFLPAGCNGDGRVSFAAVLHHALVVSAWPAEQESSDAHAPCKREHYMEPRM